MKITLTTAKYKFNQDLGGDYSDQYGWSITVEGKVVGGFYLDDCDSEVAGRTKLDRLEILPEYRMKGYAREAIKEIFKVRSDIEELYGQGVKGSENFWKKIGAVNGNGSKLEIYRKDFI